MPQLKEPSKHRTDARERIFGKNPVFRKPEPGEQSDPDWLPRFVERIKGYAAFAALSRGTRH